MRVRSFLWYLCLLSALYTSLCTAATNAEAIRISVQHYLDSYQQQLSKQYPDAQNIEYSIGALDSRLSLADCDSAPIAERHNDKTIGRMSLVVSCASPVKWSIYIPVEVSVFHPVVISALPLAKNSTLEARHLSLKSIDISRIKGSYYFNISDVVGQENKRPLKPGKPIISTNLRPPMMVKKGDAIILFAQTGRLNVKTQAIALQDGRQGQQIQVQNKQSKRVVDARVTGPGTVKANI